MARIKAIQTLRIAGIESLSEPHCCRPILQIQKVNNDMTPSYLRDKLPPHSRPNKCRHNIPNTFVEYLKGKLKSAEEPQKSHHFVDTPSEICRCSLGIEDIPHFLFECPFYATQ